MPTEQERQEVGVQLVAFQLGAEQYAINIMDVNEIVARLPIRTIPHAPEYIEGVVNLRGVVIPIISLHKRFHLQEADLSEDDELLSGFVITSVSNMKIGIIIDKILNVVTVDERGIQAPPQMLSGIGGEYIEGVVHQEKSYLTILDVHRLFNAKELSQLQTLRR